MARQTIRPYEMGVWGLQDDFIATLSAPNITHKGQVMNPTLTIKDDGTQNLSFSIPMYFFYENELVENPLWYNTKNGVLLVGLRKIKIIFNRGSNEEKVYEFVITKITEKHTDAGELTCEVEAEGLAFQELGKVGYKISLSQEEFELEYEKWFNSQEGEEPIASLDYWAKKIFENSNWTYEIQMNWSAYDGVAEEYSNEIREQNGLRRTDKVYEDEYVSSWETSSGKLTPSNLVPFKEKARMVNIEKSNRYNATQDLAEAFGVFCKYEYQYDQQYHIVGRKCIFYNEFLGESKNKIDLQYAYNSKEISRELDNTEITTKMFVVPLEDDTSASGLLTIADASANRSGEDYILNFDYLYSIGAITQEQYNLIPQYELNMFILNQTLIPLAKEISELTEKKVELEARKSILGTSQSEALERMSNAKKALEAILGDTGILEKTVGQPELVVFLRDQNADTYHINISQEGVQKEGLHLYLTYSAGSLTNEVSLTDANYKMDEDTGNFVVGLQNLSAPSTNSTRGYLIYKYSPSLYYKEIYNEYAKRLNQDQEEIVQVEKNIEKINEQITTKQELYNTTLERKKKDVTDFENIMGPALKEGSWQADSYTDYGNRYVKDITISNAEQTSGDLKFFWDDKPFDEEQLSYYEQGITQQKVYYYAIDLTNYLSLIKDHINDLRYFCKTTKGDSSQDLDTIISIGSEMTYGFYKKEDGTIVPAILFLDKTISLEDLKKEPHSLGYITTNLKDDGTVEIIKNNLVNITDSNWIVNPSSLTFVYPRICITSSLARTSYEDIEIKSGENLLKKYYDYSILYRDYLPYITLDNNFVMSGGALNKNLSISYILSNGALSLYLDALEVSKTSAFPKVSYEVSVSYFNEKIISTLYNQLDVITTINDSDLKLINTEGYISELELHLEEPWEDKITIKNYKTKFEDLFGRIVASSEQMKTNAYLYNTAAGAFTSSGTLRADNMQRTLQQVDLTYSFMNGNLTINEDEGIWGTSDEGVVAFKGGGIFTANEKDSYGNWIWNTGITPNGINASLLRAGHIDTNSIKIYSGDNVRFQMNGDGLYAYRFDPQNGEAKGNEYVVHNGEGLFLSGPETYKDESGQDQLINKVEISWDGLILRDNKNNKVFYADNEGNLTLEGEIKATKGTIGGWTIQKNELSSGDTGMASGSDSPGVYTAFWAGPNKGEDETKGFYVKSDGTLKATGVDVQGRIIAKEGQIGNLTVEAINDYIIGIRLSSLSGDSFKYNSAISETIPENENLTYKIITAGISPISYTFEYSEDGETWATIPTSKYSFDFATSEVSFNYTISDKNIIYIKCSTIVNSTTYTDNIVLYKIFDGKKGLDGTANFISLVPSSQVFIKQEGQELFSPEQITISAILHGELISSNNKWYQNNKYLSSEDGKTEITVLPSELLSYNESYTYKCENGTLSATITLIKMKNGEDGQASVSVLLSNDSISVPCDGDGIPQVNNVSTEIIAYYGTQRLSYNTETYPHYTIEGYTPIDNVLTFPKDIFSTEDLTTISLPVKVEISETESIIIEKRFTITKVIPQKTISYWIDYPDGDIFYKFVSDIINPTAGQEETTYNYSYMPVSIRVGIATQDGLVARKNLILPDLNATSFEGYSISFFGYVNEAWKKITSEITQSIDKKYYLLNLDGLTGNDWDFNQIKISIVNSSNVELYSEIKYLVWGTSEQAAKFDFVASGSYFNINNLNYSFTSDGFKILRKVGEDSEPIFYADSEGNLIIKGIVSADSGNIGGWRIESNGLVSADKKAGIYPALHSVYYDEPFNSQSSQEFFSNIGKENIETEEQAKQESIGSELIFSAGDKKSNRMGLYEGIAFKNENIPAFSVLANGLTYVNEVVADGVFYTQKTFNIVKEQIKNGKVSFIKDYHILGNTEKEYNSAEGTQEILFLGVGKIDETKYGLMMTDSGRMYAGGGNIRLAGDGIHILRGLNPINTGFNVLSSDSLSNEVLFWVNTAESLIQDISRENTSFLVDGNGDTWAKNLLTNSFTTKTLNISERLTVENVFSADSTTGIQEILGTLWLENSSIYAGSNFNNPSIIINKDGIIGQTFLINDEAGTAHFEEIVATNITTASFTKESVSSINGSLIVINNARISTFDSTNKVITLLDDEDGALLRKGYVIAIERNGEQYKFFVENASNGAYTISSFTDDYKAVVENELVLICGIPETALDDLSYKKSEDETYLEITFTPRSDKLEKLLSLLTSPSFYINGIQISNLKKEMNKWTAKYIISTTATVESFVSAIKNNTYSSSTGETLYSAVLTIKENDYGAFSKIYLRTANAYPEISLYRSSFLEENSSIATEVLTNRANSLVIRLGDLSSIRDTSFGGVLKGQGLYAENAYLKGSLIMPRAGITDTSDFTFNFETWNEKTFSGNLNDTSPIRIWAGANGESRSNAPFIVTENGSVYASQGVFKGSIYATDGIFSGHLESAGVLVDDGEDFYIARKKTDGSTSYDSTDYFINFSSANGLEVYDNGFVVFSGQARDTATDNLYLDYEKMPNTEGFNYQLPYMSVIEKEQSLVANNINVLQFEFTRETNKKVGSFSGISQEKDSISWFSNSSAIDFVPSSSENIWLNKYQEALDTKQTDYILKVDREKRRVGFGPNESSINVEIGNGEIGLINENSHQIIAVEGGLNFFTSMS